MPGSGRVGNDLFISRRHDHDDEFGWQEPEYIEAVNTAFNDFTPGYFQTSGPGMLYFGSNRPGSLGANDVFASLVGDDGTFGAPQRVAELSTTANDIFPTPRRDGLELFLTSNRTGTRGGNDLWVSTRPTTSDPWSTPVNLDLVNGDTPINSTRDDLRGAIAFDRTTLIFFSNRENAANFDLYSITRMRVTGRPQ